MKLSIRYKTAEEEHEEESEEQDKLEEEEQLEEEESEEESKEEEAKEKPKEEASNDSNPSDSNLNLDSVTLDLMEEALNAEYCAMVGYLHYAHQITGLERDHLYDTLLSEVHDEIQHARLLGRKLMAAGRKPKVDSSGFEIPEQNSTTDILKYLLGKEEQAHGRYLKIYDRIKDKDAALEKEIQDLVADEAEHLENLQLVLSGDKDMKQTSALSIRIKSQQKFAYKTDEETNNLLEIADKVDEQGYEPVADAVTKVALVGGVLKGIGNLLGKGIDKLHWMFRASPGMKKSYDKMMQISKQLPQAVKQMNVEKLNKLVDTLNKEYDKFYNMLVKIDRKQQQVTKQKGGKQQMYIKDQSGQYIPAPGSGAATAPAAAAPGAPQQAAASLLNDVRLCKIAVAQYASDRLDEQGFTEAADYIDSIIAGESESN